MTAQESRAAGFARRVIRWRWAAIVFCLLLTLGAVYGARNLSFSNDYRIYFSDDNPQLQALEELEQVYSRPDNALFLLTPETGTIFAEPHLQTIAALTEAAWQLPYSTRVDSITNYQYSWAEGDELIVENLLPDAETVTPEDVDRLRRVALAEPEIAGRLVSEDGAATLVAVTFSLPQDDTEATRQVAQAAQSLAQDIRMQHPEMRVDLSGIVILNQQFVVAAETDQLKIYPLMAVFLFVVMMIVLRSALASGLAMLVVLLSTMTGMGLAGWAGIELTSPSAAASVLILIIAVADSIHLLVTTSAEMKKGRSKHEAIVESLRLNMAPIFLTSITTAIGFLSLNWSEAPPFRHFGNIAASGAIAAWIFSILLLPAIASMLPAKSLTHAIQGRAALSMIADTVIRWRRAILTGALLLVAISGAMVTGLRINDSFIGYFSKDTEFRQASERLQAALPGLFSMEFSVGTGAPGGISDPRYLERVAAFSEWLEDQPEVGHVTSIASVMRRLNRNMHGDDPSFERLPEERDLAAQYLLLYELSLPYGLDLNNRIDIDKSASRVTAALYDVTTSEIKALKTRAETWLDANFPEAEVTEGTGVSVIFTFLTLRNIEGMLKGTAIAFVLISLCLAVALKSFKLGLLSLFVNLLPVILGFGIWAAAVGVIGIYASFVAAAALGLIVDFIVHFLSKYLRARREQGADVKAGIRYAFTMVGTALWASALILLVGFSALMLSDFLPNAYFGVMTAIVIACALAVDFLVLPPLLLWVDKGPQDHAKVSDAPSA